MAGRPLAAYQVAALAGAGVDHVIVSCAAGVGAEFEGALAGSAAGDGGRGAGAARAWGRAALRSLRAREEGDVYALNGDELLALDLGALLARHREAGAAATITVTQPPSSFGVVELDETAMVTGFDEAAASRTGSAAASTCWARGGRGAARARRPRDEHLSRARRDGQLAAFRLRGVWITVNTPKDLRRAEEYIAAQPAWLT